MRIFHFVFVFLGLHIMLLASAMPFQQYDRDSLLSPLELECLQNIVINIESNEYHVERRKNQDGCIEEIKLMSSEDFKKHKMQDNVRADEVLCNTFVNKVLKNREQTSEEIKTIIKNHSHNIVGRELLYRIIAKFDARTSFLESLKALVHKIKRIKCGTCGQNSTKKIFEIYKIFKILNMHEVNDSTAFNSINSTNDEVRKKNLYNLLIKASQYIQKPIDINKEYIAYNYNDDAYGFNVRNKLSTILLCKEDCVCQNGILALDSIISYIQNALDYTKLTIKHDQKEMNRFVPKDNTIFIDGKEYYYSMVSGPLLMAYGIPIRVQNSTKLSSVASIFHHELCHYWHITLENTCAHKSNQIVFELRKLGIISDDYMSSFPLLWSNPEELYTIFGSILKDTQIYKDRINQSNFQLSETNNRYGIRNGHYGSLIYSIPYRLLHAFFVNDDNSLPIIYNNNVAYNHNVAIV